MTGTLVLSLDFELMWGVRDHRTVADYGDAILGARSAIPRVLDLFSRYGVRGTWATVGLLFAHTRGEMIDYCPHVRPRYREDRLSPYVAVETEIGRNEKDDPFHFGASLVQRICETDGQEIATHTFSHHCCSEPGTSSETLRADLGAAKAIASARGVSLQSIVFPRNQFSDADILISQEVGIYCYRGNQNGILYKKGQQPTEGKFLRGARFLDSLIPIFGLQTGKSIEFKDGIWNVPASRFFRLHLKGVFGELHMRHILREMELAAKGGLTYHLWWHPHNMGRDIGQTLARVERVLVRFLELRDSAGMKSVSMSELPMHCTK